jgi:peptidoglycan hydrolase-like protein with peptidoglycan-binding domain
MNAGRPLTTFRGKLTGAAVTGALLIAAAPLASATAAPAQPSRATASSTPAASPPSAVSAVSQIQRFPVLRQGPNSSWPRVTVRSAQYLLRARGASLSVDGVFGARTRTAVVAFQRSRGLVADGVIGAQTWRSLIITVRLGSRGDAVRAVQDQINFRNLRDGHSVNVDGIFGPATRRFVIGLQQGFATEISGFPVDGIVGPQTWPPLVNEALSG